jgi:PAS domain S-box-containing protein
LLATIYDDLADLSAEDLNRVSQRVQQLQQRANDAPSPAPITPLPSQANLDVFLQALPAGTLLVNRQCGIVRANAVAEKMFGFGPGELAGRSLDELLPSGETHPTEEWKNIFGRRQNGSLFPLRIDLTPLQLAEGGFLLATFFDLSEQTNTERALRESEQDLRQLTELLPQLVWTCDPAGVCTWMSPQWAHYSGASVEQVAKNWLQDVHPDDRERTAREWMRCVTEGCDYRIDFRIRRHDGEYRWFDSRGVPLRAGDGRILKWFGSCTDVHDARAVRAALREEHEKLSTLAASTPGAFLTYQIRPDGSACIPYASPGVVDIFGILPEEVKEDASPLFNRIHDDDQAMVAQTIRDCGVTLSKFHLEYRYNHPAKGVVWLESLSLPVPVADGRINWHAVVMDVTSRKEMEEALQEREERFRNLSEMMPHLVWQMNPDGDSTFVNQRFIDYVGDGVTAINRADWLRIIHPDDLQPIRARFAIVKATQQPEGLDNMRVRVRRFDGVYRWFFNRMVAVRDGAGRLRHFIGTCTDIDDWVRAEESLRSSETKFRLLADSIPQMTWMADDVGSMLWFNQRWYDFTGCRAEDGAGSGWEQFHHPEHIGRVLEHIRRSWETGLPWEDTFPLRRHDGEYRWFLSRALPQRDENGKVARWFGTHTDVTEQRQSEADQQFLLNLGSALQSTVDPVQITHLATDSLGKYLSAQRCGWFSIEQDAGQFTLEHEYAADGLPTHQGVYRMETLGSESYIAALAAGQPQKVDDAGTHAATRDTFASSAGWMPRAHLVVPVIRDRKLLGAFGLAESDPRHWTDREVQLVRAVMERAWPAFERGKSIALEHVMLETLADREQRLLLTLHAASIGTWDYNFTSGKLLCDDRCKLSFGFPTDTEVDYRMLLNAIQLEDQPRVRALIDAGVSAPAQGGQIEFECRTVGSLDARSRYISCIGKVFFHSSGGQRTPYRFLGVVQDMTERKQSEDALRRANSELEQFAYAAAHDLQEPLRNVGLCTQILSSRLKGTLDAEANTFLDAALQGAIRMQAMVKDLLAYSRALEGYELGQAVANSNEVLNNVLANLQSAIEEKNALITWDELQPVRMEPLHLTQLFQNLISNGLKYAKPGEQPHIHIESWHRDAECTFSIRDNGIGIHPDYQARVFGVFRRLREVDVPGTGIGLALCKRIVEHYGGKIWIESKPACGAAFFFTVPALERKHDEQRFTALAQDSDSGR